MIHLCISYFRGKDFLWMVVREESGHWHFWTHGLGTQEEMSKFSVNLKLWNPDATDEFCCKTSVVSIDKSVKDIITDEEAFILKDAAVKRILKNYELHLEVSLTSLL